MNDKRDNIMKKKWLEKLTLTLIVGVGVGDECLTPTQEWVSAHTLLYALWSRVLPFDDDDGSGNVEPNASECDAMMVLRWLTLIPTYHRWICW